MRYDEMHRIYPDVEHLLAGVSELVHDESIGSLLAFSWAQKWIARHIASVHQEFVTAKVRQFIKAIAA